MIDWRLVLAGYYGYRNWGDEGALAVLTVRLGGSATPLVALSGDVAFTRHCFGIEAAPRSDLRQVRQAIQQSDALILGGGSLLQDATSLRSLIYYLLLIEWGLRAHGRVWLVGQGMGPFHRRISRWLVQRALNRVPFLSVRDEPSAQLLRSIGVRTPIRVDADLTWALTPRPSHFELPHGKPCVGLAPRPWRELPVQELFTTLCWHQIEAGWLPVLIPMQETQDRPLCEAIADAVQARTGVRPVIAPPPAHPAQLMGLMANLQAMVSMRLHGAIFAAAQRVPLLCIRYDPKVDALAKQIGVPLLEGESGWQALQAQSWHELLPLLAAPDETRITHLRQRAEAVLQALPDLPASGSHLP